MSEKVEKVVRISGITMAMTGLYLSLLCGPPLLVAGICLLAHTIAGR